MVDMFRLSGTTDEAIIDDRRQDMNGNREQIVLSIWFSETAPGISKKLDRKQVLKVLSLKFVYPLMGVSLAGKICPRASAEPIHELKNTVISTDVFKIFG